MKKRGISPLVATVLLIGFTIVIASMVMIWGNDLFKYYQEKTESESMIKLDCATQVSMNIKEACILGDKIKFKVENLGDKEISGFIIRTIGTSVDVNKLDEKLSPFGVSNFETNFNANPVIGIGIPRELEIYPRIIYKGKEGTCDKTSINLKPCYKLPSLLSIDEWTQVGDGYAGLIPVNLAEELNVNGLGVVLSGTNKVEIKSKSFIIPNEVKNIHIGGKTNNINSVYSLKYSDGTDTLVLSDGINGDIQPTREIPGELKGKEVYFSISVEGNSGDYAILDCLGYTNEIYGCA